MANKDLPLLSVGCPDCMWKSYHVIQVGNDTMNQSPLLSSSLCPLLQWLFDVAKADIPKVYKKERYCMQMVAVNLN